MFSIENASNLTKIIFFITILTKIINKEGTQEAKML